ncbi:MAG: arylesterase [bacterium]
MSLWPSTLFFLLSFLFTNFVTQQHLNVRETSASGFGSEKKNSPKTILFFGNSLTAGYGIGPSLAFPALIQQKIDSLAWEFEVINAGLSGETSSGGLRRVDWLLKRRIDILVLELGGNDALRGISLELTKKNLQEIIDKTKAKYPKVKIIIAGMQAPPNLGQTYTSQFRAIFPDLAENNHESLIPFLLEGVAGESALNLPDRIHPTAEGHKIVAALVWKVLKPLLESLK